MKLVPSTMMMHVAQRRQVGAAGDARPHHGRDLRDAQLAPHQRVVVEDAARAVLAGKDAVLVGQIHARRIHQVHDRQAVAHGDLLRAQDLGDRLRPPRAGLHGGVVGHDHRRPAFDAAQPGDHARRGRLPVVAVVGDQQADLEEARSRGRAAPAMRSRAVSLAGLVLLLDARRPPPSRRRASSFRICSTRWRMCACARRPRYFNLEKSAGSMKTDSGGLARILPLALGIRRDLLPLGIGAEMPSSSSWRPPGWRAR